MAEHGLRFHQRIIGPKDVVPTVLSSEHHGVRAGLVMVYEGGLIRRLTFLEVRRCQSFPDDYTIKGTIEKQYKLVGQAVPPLLMKAIVKACMEAPE
jgi:site-specific DNA-cytosine methylase